MGTNRRLINNFFARHNVEVFDISPREWARMYVTVADWWVGWDACRFAVVTVAIRFDVLLWSNAAWSEADKAHVWRIVIMEFLVFGLVYFVTGAWDGVFMSNAADLHIVANGLEC